MAEDGIIYILISPSGKTYVGQTITSLRDRMWKHLSDARLRKGSLVHRAIAKYGIDSFKIITILGVPIVLLDEWERFFIREMGSLSPSGYNLEVGGGQNGHPCLESRLKMRLAHIGKSSWNKGIPNTEVQKERISEALKGRFISDKTREACRLTGLSRKGKAPWNKGKRGLYVGPWKGKHLSEETKRKISETRKARLGRRVVHG
jgi:group I intron endonuclease